jgi:hypothetical protein
MYVSAHSVQHDEWSQKGRIRKAKMLANFLRRNQCLRSQQNSVTHFSEMFAVLVEQVIGVATVR